MIARTKKLIALASAAALGTSTLECFAFSPGLERPEGPPPENEWTRSDKPAASPPAPATQPKCEPQGRVKLHRCALDGEKEAWADFRFDISPDGYVSNVERVESSGNSCFDHGAKIWVSQMICEPGRDESGTPRWYRGATRRVTLDFVEE